MSRCTPAFQGIYIYTACEEVMQIQVAVKLGPKTPQRDWIAISESNWQTNLDVVQANHQRRTKPGPIIVELVVFVAKEQSGIRPATAGRVEEASRAIDSHLREHPDIHVGEIARTHWAITQARQPDGSTIEVPDNATFHQAQHIDAMRAAQLQQQGDTDAPMRTLTLKVCSRNFNLLLIQVKTLRTPIISSSAPSSIKLPPSMHHVRSKYFHIDTIRLKFFFRVASLLQNVSDLVPFLMRLVPVWDPAVDDSSIVVALIPPLNSLKRHRSSHCSSSM
ncbi:hypothetical protein JG687_00013846 [Phytophthora cactorum]|uniref:Uncharacterized protein n=1 Tax=Phytophthora cactorum TaxID=29920 RepID=A0A8T1U0U0_9STRA|nr:hypothetical protein JG687_00013846 [Phytophthora cactorum]